MKKLVYIIAGAVLLASCGSSSKLTRGEQYAQMYEQKPLTLLVMPPINNTTDVEAKDYLYTSISRPLAEAGYYVISPILAMDILKAESAYDSELFVDKPLGQFAKFFGADAVVFSEINSWTKVGFNILTDIRYYIKSAATGETLFERSCKLCMDLSFKSGNNSTLSKLLDLAVSAINTATTDHIVAARKANYYIFRDIPRGKYDTNYLQDKDFVAEPKDVERTVN